MPRDPSGKGTPAEPILTDPLAKRALHGWLLLGAGALAIAGVLALILAIARTPGAEAWFPWSDNAAFHKILVSHVVFAFVLWFWAMLGALAVATGGTGLAAVLGLSFATLGAALVLIPALLNRGDAVLSNYIPVLTDTTFMSGLGLFALGAAVPVVALIARPARHNPILGPGIASAGILFLLAAVCVWLAWQALPVGADPVNHADTLFWGAGHMLQFAYTALMITGWQSLGAQAFGAAPLNARAWRAVCALLVVAALPGPVLYLAMASDPAALREAFTSLYLIGLPLPIAAASVAVIIAMVRGPRDWRSPAFLALTVSLGLFLFGGLMGLDADGADTRTPAHYHAEIGGVNLALMGLMFARLLPALDRSGAETRAVRLVFWLYGLGQAVASLGLFIGGAAGVARKVAGAAQGLDTVVKQAGLGLAGAGGVVAVAGGVLFIWLALRRLLAKSALRITPPPTPPHRGEGKKRNPLPLRGEG